MSGTSREPEPPRRRRRLTAAERRRAILDAGMRAFVERGYERASMREVARGAGVTTPVIYDHFSSKRELLIALLEEREAELRAHQGRERGLAPGPELARALFDGFFSWVEEHPHAWRMLFCDAPTDPEVLAAQRRLQQRAIGQIASFVAMGQEVRAAAPLGRDAVDRLIARSIYAVNNELVSWWLEHREEVSREEVVGLAHDLVMSGVAAFRGPPLGPMG